MATSDKTRKRLWGNSGNRCAYCYRALSVDETELDDPSIVGDECHIVSGQPNGPRYDPSFPPEALDEYPNLVLLCRVDHKTVDDQQRTYDVETLRRMKVQHERKVARALELAPLLVDVDDGSDPQAFIDGYIHEFRAFHATDLPSFVPTPINVEGRSTSTTELFDAVPDGNLVVTGDSGCGKSHLLRHLCLGVLAERTIPVFVRASAFTGNFEQLLDRSVAPFRNASFESLRVSALRVNQNICVVLDALNECPPSLRDGLRESIVAHGRKATERIWISSTADPMLTDLLRARPVKFLPIHDADRTSIFWSYAPNVALPLNALAAFSTPFEISIAAETVRHDEERISAFELLSRFVHKRLRGAARPTHSHALLERVAQEMGQTFRASVSRRTLLRLATAHESRAALNDVDDVVRSGLLRVHGSDVTFMHEQVEIFFEATFFLSSRHSAEVKVASPANRRLALYVLSGLESAEEIRGCAVALSDVRLLRDMLAGRCGPHAMAIASEEAAALLRSSISAIQDARVVIHHDQARYTPIPVYVTFEELALLDAYQVALLQAIGESTRDGDFLEAVLELLACTESKAFEKASPAARQSIFADLFVLRGDRRTCAASIVTHAATKGWFDTSPNVLRILALIEPPKTAPDSALYLACSLLRHSDVAVADALRIFTEAWSRDVYHLTMEAVVFLQSRRSSANDEEAKSIREVLSQCETDNLLLNTVLTDAMLAYDMIESPVSPQRAAEEFAALLAMPDSDLAYEIAYGLISNCFEEIFQGSYLDAMHELPPEEEMIVLVRAALGADPSGFHVSWILHRLLKIADERALKAFLRWATIDPANSSFPQSSTEAFFLSVGACARLDHPFVTFPVTSKNHEAWRTLGEVVYTTNSKRSGAECENSWRLLISDYPGDVIEPLIDLQREFTLPEWRAAVDVLVWKRFPDEYRRLLENVVDRGMPVTSIHQWGDIRLATEASAFVFNQLGVVGNRETLRLLRPLATHPQWGIHVVEAIRMIERRSA